MKIKQPFYRRFMKPLEDEGGAGGGVDDTPSFDMEAASNAIGDSLFSREDDDDAPDNDREYTGKPTEPRKQELTDKEAEEYGGDPKPDPAAPVDPAAPTDPAAPAKPAPPTTWRPEASAEWDKIPPTVQSEILKREEDMFRGLESYKTNATLGQSFSAAITPFSNLLQQQNHEPAQLTHQLMSAHAMLSLGTPDQKLAQVLAIASSYGVELQPADPDTQPYEDPATVRLRNELNAVNSRIAQTEQYQREQQQRTETEIRSKLSAEITAFSADPKNVHFEAVANDIATLLQTGVAKDLADAYDQAVYRNPITRAKEIERVAMEKAESARAAAAAKAETARRATSSNVRTSAKPASGTASLGSIDDTLAETLAAINSRSK